MFTYLCGSIFAGWQISLMTVLCVALGVMLVLNIWFSYIWRIKAERQMHNDNLQNRRDALLAKLEYLKSGGDAEPQTWIDFAAFGEDDDEEEETTDDQPTIPLTIPMNDGKQPLHTVMLAVDDLSPRTRNKLGMRPKRFNGKKFYVRYSLGFDAKLRLSDDETKARYVQIVNDMRAYEGVTIEKNFSVQHIMYGAELLASIVFLGKRLCVAYALDPKQYAEGKHHGDDKSDKKRFARTPLVVRVLSDNKVETAKFMFAELAKKHSLAVGKKKSFKYDMTERSKDELVCMGSMRVIIVDEVSPLSLQYYETSDNVATAPDLNGATVTADNTATVEPVTAKTDKQQTEGISAEAAAVADESEKQAEHSPDASSDEMADAEVSPVVKSKRRKK